jgi:para-nitrobenzyl esterase
MTARENATETAKAVLANLGLDTREIDKLRTLPAARLIEAQTAVSSRMSLAAVANRRRVGFNPVVDGRILPANPFEPAAPEFSANVPVIVGTNKDEMNLFFGLDRHLDTLDEAGMREMVKSIVGDSTDRFIEIYRRSRPNAAPKDILLAIATDRTMRIDSIRLAKRKAAQNAAPVYMYMFAWETPVLGGRLKAPHALEIPFVFDTLAVSAIAGDGPERFPLAERMSKAWLAFARSGDPNHGGLPKWPAYSLEERATMIFDKECKIERDPLREERLAWTDA